MVLLLGKLFQISVQMLETGEDIGNDVLDETAEFMVSVLANLDQSFNLDSKAMDISPELVLQFVKPNLYIGSVGFDELVEGNTNFSQFVEDLLEDSIIVSTLVVELFKKMMDDMSNKMRKFMGLMSKFMGGFIIISGDALDDGGNTLDVFLDVTLGFVVSFILYLSTELELVDGIQKLFKDALYLMGDAVFTLFNLVLLLLGNLGQSFDLVVDTKDVLLKNTLELGWLFSYSLVDCVGVVAENMSYLVEDFLGLASLNLEDNLVQVEDGIMDIMGIFVSLQGESLGAFIVSGLDIFNGFYGVMAHFLDALLQSPEVGVLLVVVEWTSKDSLEGKGGEEKNSELSHVVRVANKCVVVK